MPPKQLATVPEDAFVIEGHAIPAGRVHQRRQAGPIPRQPRRFRSQGPDIAKRNQPAAAMRRDQVAGEGALVADDRRKAPS